MVKEVEHHTDRHGYRTMFVNTREEEGAGSRRSKACWNIASPVDLSRLSRGVRARAGPSKACPLGISDLPRRLGRHRHRQRQGSGWMATRYLIDLGHRSIAYLADPDRGGRGGSGAAIRLRESHERRGIASEHLSIGSPATQRAARQAPKLRSNRR
jgi:DNA-binding LacI/PurR family transcriptional regulator